MNCVNPVAVINLPLLSLLPCIAVDCILKRLLVSLSITCLVFAAATVIFCGLLNVDTNLPGLESNNACATAKGYADVIFQAFSTGAPSPNLQPLESLLADSIFNTDCFSLDTL